ncbi:GDP-mannose pyrophosphatase NudK [Shimwellia blattae]|uniref:GDP-mannose pyrophosphatase n=1 Tax=Shimwellia blattae (strain ATCC 29907 / DSM 4481 / JCM 1650 / NBRC 105725 / CDC 9005-74) TaxID=630626 RepID=I2B6P0_SHIBC|nr:GDP-mannose pyrophosphatase NudK [Shimwellia blattae]AFJ46194.1 putative hydrolase [Shimwellia blattae DSM 4481 = NBRC 105725]VDY63661.1 GDP-mannose pyrophosphatase nudK [Shimwellia blattae]VEC21756.1 GDP-mannose pyrophosphatase nudK [Shimwellia blattae]
MAVNITIIKDKFLSDNYFILRNITYDLTRRNGEVVRQRREVYDRGNGAAILLYNRARNSVVLTRQFRIATWQNGNPDGMLIEACAGLLDDDAPEVCVRREAMEETGYQVDDVQRVYGLFMSPGGVTERVHLFTGEYQTSGQVGQGGGIDDEDIDVLELPFPRALAMIRSGEICDAKTVILLQHMALEGILSPR